MDAMDRTLKQMDYKFFESSRHGVTLEEAARCVDDPERCSFLDLRTEEEARYLRFGHALHIPFAELPDRMDEVPREGTLIVFCTSVVRSSMAAFYLRAEGVSSVRTLLANSEDMVGIFSPMRPVNSNKIKGEVSRGES